MESHKIPWFQSPPTSHCYLGGISWGYHHTSAMNWTTEPTLRYGMDGMDDDVSPCGLTALHCYFIIVGWEALRINIRISYFNGGTSLDLSY